MFDTLYSWLIVISNRHLGVFIDIFYLGVYFIYMKRNSSDIGKTFEIFATFLFQLILFNAFSDLKAKKYDQMLEKKNNGTEFLPQNLISCPRIVPNVEDL